MYLIDEKDGKLVQCDCRFTDRKFILDKTRELLGNLEYQTYVSSEPDRASDNILEPIYEYTALPRNKISVTEIHSKTPYTLAFLGYYMQYNWMQSIDYGCNSDANLRKTYFEAQQKRTNDFNSLNVLKYGNHFCDYDKVDWIFNAFYKDQEAFRLFLQLYHPDCYAFQEIFPYVELTAIDTLDSKKSSESDNSSYGERNMRLLKELGLKPNIRK